MAERTEDRPGTVRWSAWSVAAVVFFLGVFAWVVVTDYRRAGAGDWPSCEGNILERSIARRPVRETMRFEQRVAYRYTVGGVQYRGDRIADEPVTYSDERTAKGDLEEAYAVGKPVTVYYDPKDPARAVLRLTPMSWVKSIATGLCVAVALTAVMGRRVMRARGVSSRADGGGVGGHKRERPGVGPGRV